MTAPGRSILFVDDDTNVLRAFRRRLATDRSWAATFESDPAKAIERIEDSEQPSLDVIVSDIRMPQVSGAEVLDSARRHQPQAIRVALSGYLDRTAGLSVAENAHRLVMKPASLDELLEQIEHAAVLCDRLRAGTAVCTRSATSLPASTRTLAELNDVLCRADADSHDVAAVIEKSPAIVAKLLQLANSSYFGRAADVDSVPEAVAVVGADLVRALAVRHLLAASPDREVGARVEADEARAALAGTLARRLAPDAGVDPRLAAQITMFWELGSYLDPSLVGDEAPQASAALLDLWGLPFRLIGPLLTTSEGDAVHAVAAAARAAAEIQLPTADPAHVEADAELVDAALAIAANLTD